MAEGRETEASPAVTGKRRASTRTEASTGIAAQTDNTASIRNSHSKRSAAPQDRFEKPAKRGRVGVHRVVGHPRRFWIYLVSALVGIVLLTAVGVIVIQTSGADLTTLTEETPESPKAPPAIVSEIDPTATIVIFNGTPMSSFEAVVDDVITQNGWGQILFSSRASSSDVQISAVFYSDPADEPAALALAKELGGVSIFQTSDYDEYGARLVVLLGSDYGGPGSEQLVLDTPEGPVE